VVFALALLIVALTLMAVGTESTLFVQRVSYRVIFPDATGLVHGSPVKMSGVRVGSVEAIRLSTDPSEAGIEVQIGVDSAYAARVREDSLAALRILQMLSGEKFVEITPGSPDRPELPEGSVIEPSQDPEILQQAAVAAENLNDITVSLKNILAKMESGEGLIARMINDAEFGTQGLEAIGAAAVNLEALTARLRQNEGFVGRLLWDEEFAAKLDGLGLAIDRLATLSESISSEQGAIGALVTEGGSGQQAIEDMRDAAASLKRVAARLESNEGLLGRLLNDPEYSDQVAHDLQRMLSSLAEIAEKINRGEGTLGAMVNERTLYDGMEDVMAGVNDSKFARWLLRHYQKKGIQAEEQEPSGAQPAADDGS
jgi:phospholipid/cholesterol/gamma-HCH transport system substrate-binding protein